MKKMASVLVYSYTVYVNFSLFQNHKHTIYRNVMISSRTDGDWKVYVTTAADEDSGTDSNVSITVYGDADNSGPIQLGSQSVGYFYSGKTDEFDVRECFYQLLPFQ